MYICVCIIIYKYMYIYVYIHIYICIHMFVYIHVYIHIISNKAGFKMIELRICMYTCAVRTYLHILVHS